MVVDGDDHHGGFLSGGGAAVVAGDGPIVGGARSAGGFGGSFLLTGLVEWGCLVDVTVCAAGTGGAWGGGIETVSFRLCRLLALVPFLNRSEEMGAMRRRERGGGGRRSH